MAKLQMPLIEQLELIKKRCEEIEQKYPHRRASYKPSFTNFDKDLRNGIVFYSSGWGWRLRSNWRETWQKKYDELTSPSPPCPG